MSHLKAKLGQEHVLYERLVEVVLLVGGVGLHEHVRGGASLRHVLVQLGGRLARPEHTRARGMHLRQVIVAEDVAKLRRQIKMLHGTLVVLAHAVAVVIEDAEQKVALHVALISRKLKHLERLGVVLLDARAVEVDQAHARLADRVALVRRHLEVAHGRGVVLLYERRAALQIELAKVGHGVVVARFGRAREIVQRLVVLNVEPARALIVQQTEAVLSLHVTPVGQQLIVLHQVVVEHCLKV